MAQASDTAQPQTPPRRDNPATVTDTNRLKALSHPTRLRILTVMSDTKPVTVGQIAEQLGESAGTVSYHLKQLEKADSSRKRHHPTETTAEAAGWPPNADWKSTRTRPSIRQWRRQWIRSAPRFGKRHGSDTGRPLTTCPNSGRTQR